jgi:hypothetical protein
MLIIKLNTLTMLRHVWFMIMIDGRFNWESSMTSMTSEHARETVKIVDRSTVHER